jgi:hypothetical protein
MAYILYPALATLLGLLGYALSTNPKIVELSKIVFACGFFFVVWGLAHKGIALP